MFLTFSTDDDVMADTSPECERSGFDSRLRHRIFFKSLITTNSIHCYIWWPVGSLTYFLLGGVNMIGIRCRDSLEV